MYIFDRLFHERTFAVSFESLDNQTMPRHLKYKLIVTKLIQYQEGLYRNIKYLIHGTEIKDQNLLWEQNQYLISGFAALQWIIDLSHISIISNTTLDEDIDVYEHRMPIPMREGFAQGFKLDILNRYTMIILFVFSLFHFGLLFMLPVVVKRVVEERQTSITEYLFLMGVGKFEHWFSICFDALSVIGLQNVIILILFSIKSMNYTVVDELKWTSYLCGIDFSLFLFLIVLYVIQSILFACLISVSFKNPNIAVIATILVWISFFYIPYSFSMVIKTDVLDSTESVLLDLMSCLLPPFALYFFLYISIGLEINTKSGAHWSNLFEPGYFLDTITMSHIIMMIFMSFLIYPILIWYFSSIVPFKNSIHKPFYFPFTYIYRFIQNKLSKNTDENYKSFSESEGIFIKHLSKSYKNIYGFKMEKVLKNVDLNVEQKSITVVLGPNGSGKTSLMNIINGLLFYNVWKFLYYHIKLINFID